MAQENTPEFIQQYGQRIGDAAEYLGETWDSAVEAVLQIMNEENRVAVDAINVYRVKRAREMQQSVRVRVEHKVTAYTIPKVVLDTALALAGGDITRLRISRDGSVTVVNKGKGEK